MKGINIRDEELTMQQQIDREHDVNATKERGYWFVVGVLFLAVVLAFCGTIAHAQTPRTATITFTRPAQYTDGTPVTAATALSYNVYQGAKGSSNKPKVGTITSTATTISSGLQPGETCWQVSTVANGVESALSNEACKTFAFPAPEVVTITVT